MSDIYPVKPDIAARAHVPSRAEYQRLYRLSLDNPEWFWAEQAKDARAGSTRGRTCSTPTTRRSTSPGTRAAG